jgi:hypothetical protein
MHWQKPITLQRLPVSLATLSENSRQQLVLASWTLLTPFAS